ncbi:MAG TPA: PAS domain S-box protein, partial [Gemmatimonadaceae bacterium]
MTARILIAGPDPAAAQELSPRLAALGYEVRGVAHTAEDAIAASAEATPDLILLDASLAAAPGGRRAVEVLRRTAAAPILFLTAEDELAAVRAAGTTARDGIVVAPFTDRDLRIGVETTMLRRDAARETQELEERFFAISIDMLCFLGFDGYFRRLNPAWERTLGFTVDELRSRPFIEFVHPDDRERTLRQNAAVRAGGRALGFENRYLCKDGSFRWFLWNAAPDPAERVIYSVARDITARKQAE